MTDDQGAPMAPVAPARRTSVVAPVQPLDVTGTFTVTVGAIVWALAFVALLPFYGTLRDDGNAWWLWTCAAGFGLGLLGRAYCRRREQRLAAESTGPGDNVSG